MMAFQSTNRYCYWSLSEELGEWRPNMLKITPGLPDPHRGTHRRCKGYVKRRSVLRQMPTRLDLVLRAAPMDFDKRWCVWKLSFSCYEFMVSCYVSESSQFCMVSCYGSTVAVHIAVELQPSAVGLVPFFVSQASRAAELRWPRVNVQIFMFFPAWQFIQKSGQTLDLMSFIIKYSFDEWNIWQ